MQNWDSMQPAQYEHNWFGNMNMFNQIKTEPQAQQSPPGTSQLEQYLTMKHQSQQQQSHSMDMNSPSPSPKADSSINDGQSFFDGNHHIHSHHHPLGFNPLTPPGLPNAVLPPISHFHHAAGMHTAGPCQSTPSPSLQESGNMQKLDAQSLTPRNTPPMDVTPPKSPKNFSEFLEKEHDLMSNSSDDTKFLESEDDENIRMPIYNSHGKMKNYKCKSCGYMAITKVVFWQHARSHMKPEKILQCPKCPFVTELKHHLEYHIRKHKNIKPFQCDKCSYSCVNKSMLNSHRKSHSSVYQYRCANCDYATKYCHSFKLHLRKYDHKPGMVLDEEGVPNPAVVIDVYGTRRGPKMKGVNGKSRKISSPSKHDLKVPAKSNDWPQSYQMPTSPAKSSTSSSSELPSVATSSLPTILHHQQQQQQQQQQQLPPMSNLLPPLALLQQERNISLYYINAMFAAQKQALAQLSPHIRENALQHIQNGQFREENNDKDSDRGDFDDDDDDFDRKSEGSAMDLTQASPTKSQPTAFTAHPQLPFSLKFGETEVNTPIISSSNSSRRKGRVLKLETSIAGQNNSISPEEPKGVPSHRNTESPSSSSLGEPKMPESSDMTEEVPPASVAATTNRTTTTPIPEHIANSNIFKCKHCEIYFKDSVMYSIHMGYHSCDDVFKCNMCGEKCDGPVGFFVHMARNAHS